MKDEGAKMGENVGEWPSVSVFVAARNEEENLGQCLKALSGQNYPGFWEVRIGNDDSTDKTGEIAGDFASRFSNFFVIKIPENHQQIKGKALVLGCLAEEAKGTIFLVCDADMQMPKGWILAMVLAMKKHGVDMINGTTATAGNNWFSALQAIDWLVAQGTFSWLSHLGVSYTAMGNNMGISRKAYEATGGYFKIPFSLTEDFELFFQAKQRGFMLIHEYDSAVYGITAPQKGVSQWIDQHVRWMVGFRELPFSQQWIFYAELLFYPLWFLSALVRLESVCFGIYMIWICKLLYSMCLMAWIRRWDLIPIVPFYEIFWWPAYFWCWIQFKIRKTVQWKGRVWEK